jgi:protein tyrosine/serine phosphatase
MEWGKYKAKMDRILYKGFGLLAALIVGGMVTTAEARGLAAQEGILNFGKVSDSMYRGAQPDAQGIASLQRLGVKMIINLRMPGDGWKEEADMAKAHGILYTNIPMRGVGRPDETQINSVLQLVEASQGPVFIHCQHGCDRTGTIVACYRIRHDQWSGEKAMIEAVHYGMSALERGMKRAVADFAKASMQLARK